MGLVLSGTTRPAAKTRPPARKRSLATLLASSIPLRVIDRSQAIRTARATPPPGLTHFTTTPPAAATRPLVLTRSCTTTRATTTQPLAFLPWVTSLLDSATQAWAVQPAPASLQPITLFVSAITLVVPT